MKQTFFLLIVAVFLLSCRKETVPTEELMEMQMNDATRTHSGIFANGPYGSVSGRAHVLKNANGTIELLLENLRSSNGPDLKVYLSKELQPINFIDLGVLRSVNGTQVYAISGNPDIMEYRYALIHCRAFNHLFGSAELQKN